MEVAHEFVAGGIVVHNCRNIDLFGQTEAAQQDAPAEGGRNRKGHPPDAVVAAALAYHGALHLRNPLALAGGASVPAEQRTPAGGSTISGMAAVAALLGKRS